MSGKSPSPPPVHLAISTSPSAVRSGSYQRRLLRLGALASQAQNPWPALNQRVVPQCVLSPLLALTDRIQPINNSRATSALVPSVGRGRAAAGASAPGADPLHLEPGSIAGSVKAGGEDLREIRLQVGDSYSFVLTCGTVCRRPAMQLVDPTGGIAASSRVDGSRAVVSLRPGETATYLLRVRIASCGMESCAYAVKISVQ